MVQKFVNIEDKFQGKRNINVIHIFYFIVRSNAAFKFDYCMPLIHICNADNTPYTSQ